MSPRGKTLLILGIGIISWLVILALTYLVLT